jgi:dihydrofolate synthase / folylpolyglutamate synthase
MGAMQQTPGMPFDTLDDWLAWLETLSPHEIVLGLDRVQDVMARLELGRPARVVHVAGTNGKGSCAAMLESLFRELGGTVGCYTSPHILDYNERIRVDGAPVRDAEIVAAFERVEAVRQGVPLTYFEYGTLAALVVFERAGAASLVLEIGMGGRLDAVNAVEPDAGIVTNVTLDHCDWLGPDVETIAREKAGIMRAAKPLVFGSEEVPRTIVSEAERIGAELRLAGRDFGYRRGEDGRWRWRGRAASLEDLAMPSLYGSVQLRNASAVLAVCEAMQLDRLLVPDVVNRAFGRIGVPGRFQWVETGRRRWLLDVAHNVDAARVLGESLDELAHPGPVTAIIGVLADKDAAGIVDALQPRVDHWVAVTPDSPRAIAARELASLVANRCNKPCLVVGTPADALRHVESHASGDTLVLVTGSFYTVGPALEWLRA